ncbi:MAG: cytochrome c maturation protein CcmE [Nitrospirota bacterium]|jgi:cytochrome c-type biogenesis protein CcmE
MRGKTKVLVVSVLLLASFGYLVFIGMREGSMFYLEVSEFRAQAEHLDGRKVRVNGEVVQGSVAYDPETLRLAFTLKDPKGPERLNVLYRGAPPDLMQKDGVTLVAEGAFDRKRDLFVSRRLLVKCPSKYEKKEGAS